MANLEVSDEAIVSPEPPYARRVVVVTKEIQIDIVSNHRTAAIPTNGDEVLFALNPLTPAQRFQLHTGEILFDSTNL